MKRRDFIKTGAVAAVAAAAQGVNAQGAAREIKVAVVGCGGRGTGGGYKQISEQDFYRQGALGNLLQAAKILREQGVNVTVKPVAFADYFLEKAQGAAKKFGVDEKNAYGGANGYKEIMKRADVDVVILTTPLNFRPIHTMAAIQAGKHVFAEKGVAVDGPGVRLMIAASKLAAEKKLTIVCGTQRRHQKGYRMVKKALDEGKLGTILGGDAPASRARRTRTISATTGSTSPSFPATTSANSTSTTSTWRTGSSAAIRRAWWRSARVPAA